MDNFRKQIATLARKFYANEISYNEFISCSQEQDSDELIEELFDLILHEPQKGGFWGVSKQEHEEYVRCIFDIIEKLESDAT